MSTANVTPLVTSRTAIVNSAAFQAVTAADFVPNANGDVILIFTNTDASPHTVTVAFGPGAVVDGVTPANKQYTLAAGDVQIVGPFRAGYYNDTSQNIALTYSATTGMKVLAIKQGT